MFFALTWRFCLGGEGREKKVFEYSLLRCTVIILQRIRIFSERMIVLLFVLGSFNDIENVCGALI